MDYIADFLACEVEDSCGKELAERLGLHLTYLCENGLNSFTLIPVVSKGSTLGVVVTARGVRPNSLRDYQAFTDLTGLNSTEKVARFLGIESALVNSQIDQATKQSQISNDLSEFSNGSRNYVAEVIERDVDVNCEDLATFVSAELTYLSNRGFSEFLMMPVHREGETRSIIIAARNMSGGSVP